MNNEDNILGLYYVILILTLPLLMSISSLATVSSINLSWYNNLKIKNMPDLLYKEFGILFNVVINILIGIGLFFLGKLRIRSESFRNPTFNPLVPNKLLINTIESTSLFETMMLYMFPVAVLLYNLAFPLMCKFNSTDIGGILNVVSGTFFVMFGFYSASYSYTLMWLFLIPGIVMIYTSIVLFLIEKEDITKTTGYVNKQTEEIIKQL